MAFSYRPATLLLLLALPACLPKEDSGDDTGDDAGTSTTGEVTTSGDASDPTTPSTTADTGLSVSSTEPTAGTAGTAGTSATGTTTGGDPSDPTSVTNMTTSPDTATTVMTSTSTTAPDTGETSDPPDPVDPPVPCEGVATPLVQTTQIAYLKSQIPPRRDPTGGTTASGSGGDELEPGTLFVKLSDQLFTCADPNAIIDCGPHWEVSIVIPPEFQTPGIHNLLGQDVRGSAFETGTDDGNNQCSFGGGSFEATFEIINIDENVVEGRLCHVNALFFDNDPELEGSFVAPRCPL